MSRIIHSLLAVVLLFGITGCNASVSEIPAVKDGDTLPKTDDKELKAQMDLQMKGHDQSTTEPEPAAAAK